jgi:hypothetical protein
VLKAKLHPASGACICAIHRKTVTARFRQLEFRLAFCGGEPAGGERRCARCGGATGATGACCMRKLEARLCCVHERVSDGEKSRGVSLSLPAEGTVRQCILDIVHGAVALASAVGKSAALDAARDHFDATARNLRTTLRECGHFKPTMAESDAQVRVLLMNGVCLTKDGKRLQAPSKRSREAHALAQSHGHLFKRLRL